MKRIFIILSFIIVATVCCAQQLIYTPYYGAVGSMTNGKVSWGEYSTMSSSSIFVSQGEIDIYLPDAEIKFRSYSSVKKGKTAKGYPYFYYQGLRSTNGIKANLRMDFTDEWIIMSIYMPSMPKPNCLKFKCKQLAEM